MAELTVPQIDFSSIGQLPAIYKQGQADALRQQTLANLGQGGPVDGKALTQAGLKLGDMSLVNLGQRYDETQYSHGRDDRNDTRQAARDAASDRHQKIMEGIALRGDARAGEDKFTIKEISDPNTGATTLVRVKTTGGEGPINTGVSPSAPNNPFTSGGKFNGDQGKAAGFTDRMLQSEGILSGIGPIPGSEGPVAPGVQNQGADLAQTGMSKIPGISNFLVSGDRQKYNQAKADFINSQLRRESGAAIAQSEFDNADKQYFPVPGDSPAVIQQKSGNRRAAIEAMGREGGSSYKPKYSFDERGGVVPYGQSAPANSGGPAAPKPGQLVDGYRYKGGNPADPASWVQSK